jgi:hypothetical protein
MKEHRIYTTPFANVYPLYVATPFQMGGNVELRPPNRPGVTGLSPHPSCHPVILSFPDPKVIRWPPILYLDPVPRFQNWGLVSGNSDPLHHRLLTPTATFPPTRMALCPPSPAQKGWPRNEAYPGSTSPTQRGCGRPSTPHAGRDARVFHHVPRRGPFELVIRSAPNIPLRVLARRDRRRSTTTIATAATIRLPCASAGTRPSTPIPVTGPDPSPGWTQAGP